VDSEWRPGSNLEILKFRASLLSSVRNFFTQRGLLEVETPIFAQHTVSEPHIKSFEVGCSYDGNKKLNTGFLQTSPEYFMKRLLAADNQPIFQICKAFRDEEKGRHHNPEFTLLEWYQPGYDHRDLMLEVRELIGSLYFSRNKKLSWEEYTYQALFEKFLNINPHLVSLELLANLCEPFVGIDQIESLTRDDCLDLLLSHKIAPKFKNESAVFIYEFPQSQAALAKLKKNQEGVLVASRFELIINGLEIANGYHELTDYEEQKKRFSQDNRIRKELGLSQIEIDHKFLAALKEGLPKCAGVAVGLDRLLMLLCDVESIAEVQAFSFGHL